MPLRRLTITQVRNLKQVALDSLSRVNVLYGSNGSGKTSVLEAIHILGTARSFRSPQIRTLIQHGADQCTVYGELETPAGKTPLGVQKLRKGGTSIKIGGRVIRVASELAEQLPLQVINAQSFALLVGTPLDRRQFLDWGVFHVEHGFNAAWRRFHRAIKQRNELLRRDKISDSDLRPWTAELVTSGTAVDVARSAYFDLFHREFQQVMARLSSPLAEVDIRYRRGWDSNLALSEAMAASEMADRAQGYTHTGPQRADLRVVYKGHGAGETLSRGQQKLVVAAMKLAQGRVLKEVAGQACVYLVDDLPAELDREHASQVAAELDILQAQVFITCVEETDIAGVWPAGAAEQLKMFHVEHGEITPQAS